MRAKAKAFTGILLSVAAWCSGDRVMADVFQPYIGLGLGEHSSGFIWNTNPANLGPTRDETAFKLIGGLRPLELLGVEFEYVDFRKTQSEFFVVCAAIVGPCPSFTNSFEAQAISVSAMGFFDVGPVELFGRYGISFWDLDRTEFSAFRAGESGTDASFGAGIQYNIGRLALRVEYENFELSRDSRNLVSVGFTYSIGEG